MKKSTAMILLIVSVGLFYTFTNPVYKNVQALQAQAAEYKNVLNNASRIRETRDNLELEYQKVPKAEVDKLLKILPDNIDNVRLALDLDSIAARYGISIRQVQVDDGTDNAGSAIVSTDSSVPYRKVRVTFSFVSTYENFKKFLSDIEESMRLIDVRELSFSSTENGLYEYRLGIDTYWLK